MTGKRAEVLLEQMALVERYTLGRAFHELSQEEFDWEPHPGAWGVRRREDCRTPNPSGRPDGAWVCDQDWQAQLSAWPLDADGTPDEPMTTIGWLLNHIGAAPGRTARLDLLGGDEPSSPEAYR